MKKVSVEGKEYDLVFNNFVLYKLCKGLGEKNISGAINRLSGMMDKDGGLTVDGLEAFSMLTFEMLSEGARKSKKPIPFSLEDCFNFTSDIEVVNIVSSVFTEGMPAPETQKAQSEGKAAAV